MTALWPDIAMVGEDPATALRAPLATKTGAGQRGEGATVLDDAAPAAAIVSGNYSACVPQIVGDRKAYR